MAVGVYCRTSGGKDWGLLVTQGEGRWVRNPQKREREVTRDQFPQSCIVPARLEKEFKEDTQCQSEKQGG